MSTALDRSDLNTVDLTDLDLFGAGPPYELFARMRSEAPVCWMHHADGRGFWSLTKAADIEAVSKDPVTFSSYEGGTQIEENVPQPLELKRLIMLNMDPPEHTKHRLIVNKVFTPHRVNQQEARIRERVTQLLDAVCERGTCDFVSDIAVELPLQTIAEMLGVPQADRMKLFDWTTRLEAAMHDPHDRGGMDSMAEMGEYLAGLVADRRERPTEDVISALTYAEVDGESLDDAQIIAFFTLLMFAGNDTTRNTASGGQLALMEHPGERQKLIADPALIPGAVEEMLRWVSAVVHFRRTATADTELGGVKIKKGDRLVMWYPSANRDEDLVPEPTRFCVTREGLRHQAFGGGGRHFCLGAGLARLQLRVLFEELLSRLPDMEPAGAPIPVRSNFVHGLESLPVRFSPSPRRRRGRGRDQA